MKKMLALFAAGTTLLGTLSAAPAQAATTVDVTSVSTAPTALVLDGDAGCANRVRVIVNVYDPGQEVTSGDVDALVYDGAGRGDFVSFSLNSRFGDDAVFAGWWFSCAALETPGRFRVAVEVRWMDEQSNMRTAAGDAHFIVRRPTALSYNAWPEPVKRGQYLTHQGRLMFDPYSHGDKYGAKGVRISFYFKKDGTSTYAYKGWTTTGNGGYYLARQRAWDSGLWKAIYAGDAAHQPQNMWDAIRVTR